MKREEFANELFGKVEDFKSAVSGLRIELEDYFHKRFNR